MKTKQRGFVFTNFNLNTAEWYEANKDQVQFVAYGDEICPDTGRAHQQAFVYFKAERSFAKTNLKRMGSKIGEKHVHIQPMRGSFQQNEEYCSKEKHYHKLGDEPKQGARGDIAESRDAIMRGDITVDDILVEDPSFYHQYGRTLRALEAVALRQKYRTWMTDGLWLCGPTGVGKSHHAFEGYTPETHYIKNLNEDWWDGYKGQETVIFNEFRGQVRLGELLDLMDKWPKSVKWRGQEPVPFLAKKLIITSSKEPEELYHDKEDSLSQLYRRCTIRRLTKRESTISSPA